MNLEKVIDHMAMKIAQLTKENAILRVSLEEEKEKESKDKEG